MRKARKKCDLTISELVELFDAAGQMINDIGIRKRKKVGSRWDSVRVLADRLEDDYRTRQQCINGCRRKIIIYYGDE